MAQQGQPANNHPPSPLSLTATPDAPAAQTGGQPPAPQQLTASTGSAGASSQQSDSNQDSSGSTSGTHSGPTQSHATIPLTAPPGEIIITQPPLAAQAGVTSLFKIWPTGNPNNASANWLMFGWNITNVYEAVKPTSLTVQAKCDNGYTYPVGGVNGPGQAAPSSTGNGDGNGDSGGGDSSATVDQDGVIPASQSTVIWDPVQFASAHPDHPVPQGLCTLQIADDDRGFTALHRAGYLTPNTDAIIFALYTGEAYTPISSSFSCPECKINSISSSFGAHPIAISILVGVMVCVLSGAGVLVKGSKVAERRGRTTLRQDMGYGANGVATGANIRSLGY